MKGFGRNPDDNATPLLVKLNSAAFANKTNMHRSRMHYVKMKESVLDRRRVINTHFKVLLKWPPHCQPFPSHLSLEELSLGVTGTLSGRCEVLQSLHMISAFTVFIPHHSCEFSVGRLTSL